MLLILLNKKYSFQSLVVISPPIEIGESLMLLVEIIPEIENIFTVL